MVAVGSAHALYNVLAASGELIAGDEDQEERGEAEARTERFTLVEYNKAIQALNNKLTAEGPRAVSVVLICCILFVCLEALNRNPERAIRHVESGRKIFNDWSRRTEQLAGRGAPNPVDDEMRNNLWRICTRLHHQVLMITGSQDWADQIEGLGGMDPARGGINAFRSLDDAQDALDSLSKLIFPFLKASLEYKHVALDEVPPEIVARREPLGEALRSFDASLGLFQATMTPATPDRPFQQSLGALRVQLAVLKVMLGEALGKTAAASPRYEADLAGIIAQCERVLQGAPSLPPEAQSPLVVRGGGADAAEPGYTARAPSFALASGLPSALYFVSQASASGATRQQAVALLKAANINDGVWSSAMTAKIAETALEARAPAAAGTPGPALGLLELGRKFGVIDDDGDDDDDDGSNLAPSRGE